MLSKSGIQRVARAVGQAAAKAVQTELAAQFAASDSTQTEQTKLGTQQAMPPMFAAESGSSKSKSGQQQNDRRRYLVGIIATGSDEAEAAQGLLSQAGGKPFSWKIPSS
jgi:hypothetical protein